jgi:hypothetical protein
LTARVVLRAARVSSDARGAGGRARAVQVAYRWPRWCVVADGRRLPLPRSGFGPGRAWIACGVGLSLPHRARGGTRGTLSGIEL